MKSMISGLSLVLLFQLGCASKGFNRGELKNQIGVTAPTYDDSAIKAAFAKKANLPKPFKLAVYFKSPASAKSANENLEWRWTEQDKSVFDELTNDLKAKGLVSEVLPLNTSLITDEGIKSLRLAAAQMHADALLVVGGASDIDRYMNNWGWAYTLLVPTLFVPGSQADTLFMSNATLWDVRNEFLYLSAEAEATTQERYVAAFAKPDKVLINEAKTASLTNLKGEISKMVDGAKF
jgi:hypothetical protein